MLINTSTEATKNYLTTLKRRSRPISINKISDARQKQRRLQQKHHVGLHSTYYMYINSAYRNFKFVKPPAWHQQLWHQSRETNLVPCCMWSTCLRRKARRNLERTSAWGNVTRCWLYTLFLGGVRGWLKCSNRSTERFGENEVQEQLKCAANGATEEKPLQRTLRHPAQHGQKCQTVKYTFSL